MDTIPAIHGKLNATDQQSFDFGMGQKKKKI